MVSEPRYSFILLFSSSGFKEQHHPKNIKEESSVSSVDPVLMMCKEKEKKKRKDTEEYKNTPLSLSLSLSILISLSLSLYLS